jgi:mono/diheme cytochrome c family protein
MRWFLLAVLFVIPSFFYAQDVEAKPSACEACHIKISPLLVKDFNRGKMAETMTCEGCHGTSHTSEKDVDKAELPTIQTCQACHPKKAGQYLEGKHALGLIALEAMPYTHRQPDAFVKGQKGCAGCHTLGLTDPSKRKTKAREYYAYGMDCQNCHTRHAFSKAEAKEPEACKTCHMGFDHPQWEMWSGSKHGVGYLMGRAIDPANKDRAPTCQTCHMPDGNHRVFSAWGFLGVRLPESDKEWMKYRVTILKGLGVLDPGGKPTKRLEVVKAGKVARLTKEAFDAERARYTKVCVQCHTPRFVKQNLKNADLMLKEADKIFAEAIEIVADLYKEGLIRKRKDYPAYPDLLTFYDVNTKVEELLYEMFMDYRMKTFQGAFHMNPDYTTWYGYAKMKTGLVEMKEIAADMRRKNGK